MNETQRIREYILGLKGGFTSRQVINALGTRDRMTMCLISEMQKDGSIKKIKGKTKRCGFTFAVNHDDSGEAKIDVAEIGMINFIFGGDASRICANLYY